MNHVLPLYGFLILFLGCPLPQPQPLPMPGPMDAGPPPYNADAEPVPYTHERQACQRMCDKMQALGCTIGEPTPVRREPCLSWCTRVQSKHEIDLHPDCIANVAACARVKDCDQ